MKYDLSIIIACYNSAETLGEALDSAYTQDLKNFEIVLVDDGSSDATREIIEKYAAKQKNINYFFHEKNRGGGAARNTGIRNAGSDLFFCLDSDDILTPGMLSKMLACIREKKCDGVGIETSIKFIGKNTSLEAYRNVFPYTQEPVPFDSLFGNHTCSLYSTFLFTRKAFDLIGGYPENHGFDTQGIAFRFLSNGLVAYTCPGAVYMHRIKFHQSYYMREDASGNVPENWRKIYEEFLFLFNDETKDMILDETIDDITEQVREKTGRFAPSYQDLIKQGSREYYYSEKKAALKKTPYDWYWLGCEAESRGEYGQAAYFFVDAIAGGMQKTRVYRRLLQSAVMINNISADASLHVVLSKISSEPKAKKKTVKKPSVARRILNKIASFRK